MNRLEALRRTLNDLVNEQEQYLMDDNRGAAEELEMEIYEISAEIGEIEDKLMFA
jgi:hypothetical protein